MGTPPPPAAPQPQRHRPLRPHPSPKRLPSLLSLSPGCFVPTDPVPVVPIPCPCPQGPQGSVPMPVPRVPATSVPPHLAVLVPRVLVPVPGIPSPMSLMSPMSPTSPVSPTTSPVSRCPRSPRAISRPLVTAPVPGLCRPWPGPATSLASPGPCPAPLGDTGTRGTPRPPRGWLCVGARGTRRSPAPQESRRRRSAE